MPVNIGDRILQQLRQVEALRRRCQADPRLASRVAAVKAYQHRRFQRSYADLLAHPRFGASAQFFLEDLYGPHDFTDRDTQFARVVPGLVRLFPAQVVSTVEQLSALHALSEDLDVAMAMALPDQAEVDAPGYVQAWRCVGRREERLQQVALMDSVGQALDRYTRNPLLWRMLVAMRVPARAAGLSALQGFLERGFTTFRGMKGGGEFLTCVRDREIQLIERLFACPGTPQGDLLGELP